MLRLVIVSLLVLLTGCASAVSGHYPCADNPGDCSGSGYGGPYEPKALDLYRPGRFEDLDSPGF